MANLCGILGRFDEGVEWFAKARVVLDEQGARVSRAWNDLYEAQMYARRDENGNRGRVLMLVDSALEQFHAIGMPGWVRFGEELRARCVPAAGELPVSLATVVPETAAAGTPVVMQSPIATLRHEGDYWMLTYDASIGRLKDSKGLHYLAHLLRHAGEEFHALDLVQGREAGARGTESGMRETAVSSQGLDILDPAAKSAYKLRLAELRQELAEAEQFHDNGRVERARTEIEAIAAQLSAAVGLGGRNRSARSTAERARSSVTQRIKDAIKAIHAINPVLGTHLNGRVQTGTFCVYLPDATSTIEWRI
jgi:non-specific serine/threonine protein kinase